MFESKITKILSWMLLLLIFISGCITDPDEQENKVLQNMSAEETYQLIEENKGNADFIIIDIRTEVEYDQGYIQNAINIDYYLPDFSQTLQNLDKNKTYLIYCRSGNRSSNTLNRMNKLDFMEVYNLEGGIIIWIEEGYPITEDCKVC